MKTENYSSMRKKQNKVSLLKQLLILFFIIGVYNIGYAQIGTQSPSIQSGVTFQWSDEQDINTNGDIDNAENNRAATIESVTINGVVYNTFAFPSAYQLTRLGPAGNGTNGLVLNSQNAFSIPNPADPGNPYNYGPNQSGEIIGTSASATLNINDFNDWDTQALAAFQSPNLNFYFASNGNGDTICEDFDAANGLNGVPETDSQMQTLFYDPPIPSNTDGVFAITERGGNNCLYVRVFGIPPGGGPEQALGDTFIRTGGNLTGGNFAPPSPGSDYWESGREIDNGQTVAIGLFFLNSVAPTGSQITRVRFIAASNDDGDGKFFILQRYAQPQTGLGCIDEPTFNGQIDNTETVPAGSTYAFVSGPTPAGQSFTLNTDGSYTYVSSPGFTGDVTFEYEVTLPAPNDNISDTNTVTLTYNPLPENPTIDVVCNADGTYNMTITNPVGSQYEYNADLVNGGAYQASPVFSNLGPGTYNFGIRDLVTGCENRPSTTSITLETFSASVETTNDVNCFGEATGSIDITVVGGFPPYTFLWNNGATTEDLNNVPAGSYNVQISDSSGCEFEFVNAVIIDGPSAALNADEVITNITCFGEATGAIDITVTGGTPAYTFLWSNGATTEDIACLLAGTYTVDITDANDCTYQETFTITQPSSGMNLSFTQVNVLCNGDGTGSIDLTVIGGTAPYSYAWSNGETTEDISSISAGAYNVVVTDANCCTATLGAPIQITQPEPISIELTQTNATATGACNNGTATATVTGGVGPYTYLWNDPLGQTTPTATGLSGDPVGGTQYTVTITDANGCVALQSVVINCVQDCDAVISVDPITNIDCKGDAMGSATVNATSQANPNATFTFTWNTDPVQVDAGVTSSTISGQTAGVYTVSVTIDGTLCLPVEESITITEPSTEVSVSATATDETGPTTNDGTATANPSGGTPPYTYSWSPGGETTQTITGLSDGDYTVTVTDANGCTATTTVTVNDGDCLNLTANASATPVSCNGGNDGTATVVVTGGLGTFTYLWNTGATTKTITGLVAGTYTVTVTDTQTLCTTTSTATVNEPTALSTGIAVTNAACHGESTGSLDLTVTGGTQPYSFAWSNGATTEDIINLPAGSYSVTVTDANGCMITDNAVILQPAADLALQIDNQTNVECTGLGSVTVSATGGTAPYSFNLDGVTSQSNGTFNDLAEGSYTVNVIDANGCTESITVFIQNACIAIVKQGTFNDANGDGFAQEGETISYSFTVTNMGNVTLSNVTITDPLFEAPNPVVPITFDGGDTNGNGELDLDETWTFSAVYTLTQDDIDNGSVTNQATATGQDPDGDDVSDVSDDDSPLEDDPTVTPLPQNPVIAIVKAAVLNDNNQSGCSDAGIDTISYTFTVTNEGNVSLASVTVTDPLPGLGAINFDGGDTDGDNELDIDETWTYSAEYTLTQDDIDLGSVTNQATAEGTGGGQTVSDLSGATIGDDDPTVTDVCQSPAIAIVKTGVLNDNNQSGCSDAGIDTISYTFIVTNEGNVSLASVTVTDPLPGLGAINFDGGDTDGDNELDIDETWTYSAEYTLTQDDIDLGSVTNQATAEGTGGGQTVSDLSGATIGDDDPTVTDVCQSPAIAIVKESSYDDGGDCSQPGEEINYTFTVTNEGNVSLANIIVDDPLLGGPVPGPDSGDTDNDGELDVTETWIYTGVYVITQIDIDNGEVVNTATADGTAPDGTVVTDQSGADVGSNDPTVTELCQEGSIAIIKEGTFIDGNGDGCADPGETIEYVFTVANTGNVTLTDVTVTDPLITVVGGPITLAPTAIDNTTFTGTYVITQADIDAGEVVNQATAEGTLPNGDTVTDLSDDDVFTEDDPTVTPLCQEASIALIKVGTVMDENGSGCADPKETISYEFTVINTGNVTLTNIDIDDPLVNVVGGPITLAPGASDNTSFTAVYLITQANIDAGFVENQAEARGFDPNNNVVTDLSDDNSELEDDPTITALCQEAQIALIKTGTPSDENGNGCIDLGETIVYDFVVSNLGNVELTNVIVTDPMVDVVGGPVTIAAGESDTETFSAVYTVTQDDVDAGFVTNQAIAEGTAPNGDVVMDLSDDNSVLEDDPTVSVLCQEPSLSLEKTGVFIDVNGDGVAQAGETIEYSFTVTNTGNVTIFNITIDDPLPGVEIIGGPIEVLEPGEVDTDTFTGLYTITEQDIENGEVVNQATATGFDANGNEVSDTSDDPNNFDNVDPNGDGDPDDPTITKLPDVLGAVFEIFNGITPNADNLNDFFEIRGIQDFPNNNVKIFNRWGVLVWETDGYGGLSGEENVFRGESNGRATISSGELLPTGTYFYILTILGDENPGQSTYTGYLYINR